MKSSKQVTSNLIPRDNKKKGVDDYMDVEGRPFMIKKIMSGRRITFKEMDAWPKDAPDWRKEDNLNRKGRKICADGFRDALVNELEPDDTLIISKQFVEDTLLPLLEGRALPPKETL
ncbi:MAG: hypothetical protein JRC86_04835 [Deltaproteobacteria bacterium]|nr:hypothetical protein [Deltaproteobacteria bacterium]